MVRERWMTCCRGRRAQIRGQRWRWLPEVMPKGDRRVARASALRDVIYGEVLQRKGVHPMVRGGA
jgi:hypothetical protein